MKFKESTDIGAFELETPIELGLVEFFAQYFPWKKFYDRNRVEIEQFCTV